ncbi:hypothetical protein [Xenorhabdus stockiae]|uniref:hypothetical protein n=1 Tax=Xenorhabdus stockiae TaxID=351614 RepID=UPI004063EE23
MIKEIYGVKIFPLVVMFYQVRRWWALRKLRNHWHHDQKFAQCYQQHKWARRVFNIEWNYLFIKHSARAKQQRGEI